VNTIVNWPSPAEGEILDFRRLRDSTTGPWGKQVSINRRRSSRRRVASIYGGHSPKNQGFLGRLDEEQFSLFCFFKTSTVARAAMQDGREYTGDRPSVSPSWAACRICPLLCSFGRAEWDSPPTLAGVLYWGCQKSPLSGPSGATYRWRTQNRLPLNLT
jgi:hypothetical protein